MTTYGNLRIPMDNELLTKAEVMKILKISASTLRRWDRSGKLKAFQPTTNSSPKYDPKDVQKFVERNK